MSDQLAYRQILTTTKAGERLSLHPETVRRRARDGKLEAKRTGNAYVFDAKYIDALSKGIDPSNCCVHCDNAQRANIIWTCGGACLPVCWYHFRLLIADVLGIGRDTAVGVGDG